MRWPWRREPAPEPDPLTGPVWAGVYADGRPMWLTFGPSALQKEAELRRQLSILYPDRVIVRMEVSGKSRALAPWRPMAGS